MTEPLESLQARAGQAFDKKRFGEALALYRRLSKIDADDGHPLLMAAVSRFELGDDEGARHDLDRALMRRLSPEDHDLADLYQQIIDPRTPASAWESSLASAFSGGYDGNVHLLSPGALEASTQSGAAAGALFASMGLELGISRSWASKTHVQLGYEFFQLIYSDAAPSDLALQEHGLEIRVDQRLAELVKVTLAARGELAFTGMGTRLVAFQNTARLDAEVILGSRAGRVRVGGAIHNSESLDPDLSFLSGQRFEVRAGPEGEVLGWRASLSGRLRKDVLGASREELTSDESVATGCTGCTVTNVVPYSNQSVGVSARLAAPVPWFVRPAVWLRWEQRTYDDAEHDEYRRAGGGAPSVSRVDVRARSDERRGAGASLGFRLHDVCTFTLRYDFTQLLSTYTDMTLETRSTRGYDKQTIGAELTIDWL